MSTPCFGIIFEKVTNNKVTGHKLFQSFIKENKACFWNMKLGEAINSMKYVGYIKPSTLFITSLNENHMQTLRDAWVQQILRSAKGYRIKTFGDVESIGIHKIDQIHLVPLLDIVCDVVAKMNQSGRPAVLQTLQNEIGKEYPEIKTPSMRTLRQAIQTLLKQKTLKYDLKQLRICFPSTPPYRSKKITITKCTVECQTGQSVANGYTPSNHFKTKKNLLARLFMKKDCAQKVSQPIEHCRNRTRLRGHPERPTISAECNNDVVMPSKTKK
ncbi:unnamed protein product [Thelazia callipaeda]|uniref:Stork_head domain-containing protein n=1 Tax=Thelazia callipaeda TaxID=103827 RepID=A0A0N5CZ15_THECL|nr:unnamed protein product [Thelazia callipaeda]